MSVEIALMVASTAISMMQQASQSRAQEHASEVQAGQSAEAARAAAVEAKQREAQRLREFYELQASNRNAAQYDTYGSASFQAIRRRNLSDMEDDLAAINYSLTSRSKNLETTADLHMRNKEQAATNRKLSLVKGAVNIGATIGKYGGSPTDMGTTPAYGMSQTGGPATSAQYNVTNYAGNRGRF